MQEKSTAKGKGDPHGTTFWQSMLRFGLPFTALFATAGYFARRLVGGEPGLPWPWGVEAVIDAALLLLASAIWWWLMREIAFRKRKNGRA